MILKFVHLLCIVTLLIASFVADFAACRAAEQPVMPIKLPAKSKVPAAAAMQDRIYVALEKHLHAVLPLIHPWDEDPSLRLLTKSASGEHQIRPNTATIEGMAILYRFGPYDEKITGISRADLLDQQILPMLRYCIETHKTGDRKTSDGKHWGDAWQSAHWAQMIGNAAWFIWDDLPEDCRVGIRKLVGHEADRFVNATPPHNLHNDTKAEENAWNSQIMAVAVVLMPEDPRRAGWEKAFQRWAISSFLRPADEHSQEIVDGKTVAEQYTGANIFDDFTLENHGIIHPDYMSTYDILQGCSLRYSLTGRKPLEALKHNTPQIYENLKWLNLLGGGILYPNGQDWELFRDPRWLTLHLSQAVFCGDPDAWRLANYSLDTLEKSQSRSANGDVLNDDEVYYAGARMQLLRSMGIAWLTLGVADKIVEEPHDLVGTRRFDQGKIILNRTPKVINSFSWGAKTMAMCVPIRLDRVVSPAQRDGVGRILLVGSNDPLPVRTAKANVTNDEHSFTGDVIVEHGDKQIRAELHVAADAQGVMTLREKLTAVKDVTTTKVATGLIGILNNPHWVYENGQRRLTVDGKPTIFTSLSGKNLQQANVKSLDIDSVLRVASDKPLQIEYQAAKKIEHGRATDNLYLNYLDGKHAWKAGEVISEFEVRISASQ